MTLNTQVTIRLAHPDDLPGLVTLEQEAFSDPWPPVSIQEALADERYIVLVAHSSRVIHGSVIASVARDEGEIGRLAVAAAWRRHGIGSSLLQAALDECSRRGVVRIFLEVRAPNQSACSLYEKIGFQRVGLRRRYYQNGEDAVVMEKLLSTQSSHANSGN